MDLRPQHIRRLAAVVGLAGACALTGCARDRYFASTPSPGGRTAFRPSLDRPDVKPMFVGGYAGHDYNRMTRPKPMRVEPMRYE
ncbi:hypothetical protein [Paludisphaera sp.]|uniref:hypothetical protein n=1 Tax=Paludisphaera sp. TaxID=2017432 RepID=UPI00301E5337